MRPKTTFCSKALIAFFITTWLLGTGCGLFKKLGQSFGTGLGESKIDSLLQATAGKVLDEAVKTERFQQLERQLSGSLDKLGNHAQDISDELLKNVLMARTKEWMASTDADLQKLISNSKNNLTDGQLRNYLQSLESDLAKALQNVMNDLAHSLNGGQLQASLNNFRRSLGQEIDTLLEERTDLLLAKLDEEFMPRVDTLLTKVGQQRKETKKDISSIIWIGSLAAIIIALVAFLIRTHILKLKYRKMMEIVTVEIDSIDRQPVYDRLVNKISEEMKSQGLETLLRQAILEKQGLIDQPQWNEKDHKLLKLMVAAQANGLDKESFHQELKRQDLETHFLSKRAN